MALDGTPLTFDTRKAVALLAYLAVTGQPHRRETLAALLWPESEQTRARAALRRTLSVAGAVGPALQVGRGEIALDGAVTWSDVVEFERLADSGDPADLRRAVDLARAPLLAGFSLRDSPEFDDWVASTSDHLGGRLARATARLTEADIGAGLLDEALVTARRWVAHDPLSEPAHRAVMRLLTWTGERPGALRQYRACTRVLDRELGVSPLPETTALYDDIRADRLEPPDGVRAGRTVAHVRAPDATSTTAGGSAGRTVRIPVVGRATQLERLDRLWRAAEPTGRAVAVTGAPGLGRTALAAEFASAVTASGGPSCRSAGTPGRPTSPSPGSPTWPGR